MEAGRYAEAIAGLTPVAEATEAQAEMSAVRRLARNLQALREYRPAVYGRLEAAGVSALARQVPRTQTLSGKSVPAQRSTASPGPLAVSRNPDPEAAARRAVQRLAKHIERGRPIVFGDLIDGYLVSQIAAAKPTLPRGEQQPVYLVETDPGLVVACLMIHDWAGADGPIRDERFVWRVGPKAYVRLEALLRRDRTHRLPSIRLGRAAQRSALAELIKRCERANAAAEARWARRIETHYWGFDCGALTVGKARRPKALLLASRFSAAGAEALDDCEAAFARLGWRTQRLTERTAAQRVTGAAVRRVMATFQPDLVFGMGLPREAWSGVLPGGVPYLGWDQGRGGGSVAWARGDRDFVVWPVGSGRGSAGGGRRIEVPALVKLPASARRESPRGGARGPQPWTHTAALRLALNRVGRSLLEDVGRGRAAGSAA